MIYAIALNVSLTLSLGGHDAQVSARWELGSYKTREVCQIALGKPAMLVELQQLFSQFKGGVTQVSMWCQQKRGGRKEVR